MSLWEAVLLGFIQGLTEFLPVSSSGHLKLTQSLLGMKHLDQYLLFDLVCHLGTLCVIVFVFFNQLKDLRYNHTRLIQIGIATLPLMPLVFVMKCIKGIFDKPELLGFFFLVTSLFLFVGTVFGKGKTEDELYRDRWRDAFLIGIFQAIAILPGVSRSGSTISSAWFFGWNRYEATVFSFLIGLVAVLGGTAYELMQTVKNVNAWPPIGFEAYLMAFLTSAMVGFAALKLLLLLVVRKSFLFFSAYTFALGLFCIYYYNFA